MCIFPKNTIKFISSQMKHLVCADSCLNWLRRICKLLYFGLFTVYTMSHLFPVLGLYFCQSLYFQHDCTVGFYTIPRWDLKIWADDTQLMCNKMLM